MKRWVVPAGRQRKEADSSEGAGQCLVAGKFRVLESTVTAR
jgi:hypothetical protein